MVFALVWLKIKTNGLVLIFLRVEMWKHLLFVFNYFFASRKCVDYISMEQEKQDLFATGTHKLKN